MASPAGQVSKYPAYAAVQPELKMNNIEFDATSLLDDEVAIDVTHCGICHSDLHKVLDEWSDNGAPSTYPLVPGHEAVGRVVAVGAKVTTVKVGDRVGCGPQRSSCRTCADCLDGFEQTCDKNEGLYDPHTGGFGSYLRVNEHWAFKLPESIPSVDVGPLMCAGVTVFSPLINYEISKRPAAEAKVGIVGVGGLGHLAVQFASKLGYHVVGLTTSADKAADILKYGAKEVLVTKDDKAMNQAAGTFDFILSTVSAKYDINVYLNLLRAKGKFCLIGAPSERLELNPFGVIFGNKTVCGSLVGSISDTKAMLDFAAKHNIRPTIEVVKAPFSDPTSAERVTDAMKKVASNTVRYRMVLDYGKE